MTKINHQKLLAYENEIFLKGRPKSSNVWTESERFFGNWGILKQGGNASLPQGG